MHTFSKIPLALSLFLCLLFAQTASAQSMEDIQDYCQSMSGSGMSEEDTKSFMDDCIAEQRGYLEQERVSEPQEQYDDSSQYQDSYSYEDSYQEPQYEQEDYGQEQNCYTKVDEHIQKLLDTDPNTAFDYDQLVDQCLNGKL